MTMTKRRVDILPRPEPVALRLDEAAAYVGVGTTCFLKAVASGRFPQPIEIERVKVWPRRALEDALYPSDPVCSFAGVK